MVAAAFAATVGAALETTVRKGAGITTLVARGIATGWLGACATTAGAGAGAGAGADTRGAAAVTAIGGAAGVVVLGGGAGIAAIG